MTQLSADRQALRDNRTYHVSDERLREFAKLSYAQRLQWVEQCARFVRLGQHAKEKLDKMDKCAMPTKAASRGK